jgi:hypothetical protein
MPAILSAAMSPPNLIVAGVMKCGTSSLHGYLAQHPDIFMTDPKEPHSLMLRDADDEVLAEWDTLFADAGDATIRGESSTNYFHMPGIAERMGRLTDELKLIVVFRNPVDRVWSHYTWLRRLGLERRSFRRAFEAETGSEPDPSMLVMMTVKNYERISSYPHLLERYLARFDRDDIHIVTTEALAAHGAETVRSCYRFLGVADHRPDTGRRANVTVARRFPRSSRVLLGYDVTHPGDRRPDARLIRAFLRVREANGFVRRVSDRVGSRLAVVTKPDDELDPDERRRLVEHYRDDVTRLRALTGCDFAEWDEDFPRS